METIHSGLETMHFGQSPSSLDWRRWSPARRRSSLAQSRRTSAGVDAL